MSDEALLLVRESCTWTKPDGSPLWRASWHRAIAQPIKGWAILACSAEHTSQIDACSRLALIESVPGAWKACERCLATAITRLDVDGRVVAGVRYGGDKTRTLLREIGTGDHVCIVHDPARNGGKTWEAGRAWSHARPFAL